MKCQIFLNILLALYVWWIYQYSDEYRGLTYRPIYSKKEIRDFILGTQALPQLVSSVRNIGKRLFELDHSFIFHGSQLEMLSPTMILA